jgi:adenylate cyclase
LKPFGNLAVVPLLSPDAGFEFSERRASYLHGEEREVAVLFCDLRGFTRITQSKLPHDVVFLLNHYFRVMDDVIAEVDGVVSQFAGDGIMAIFGVTSDVCTACQNSVAAARLMFRGLDRLNGHLAEELDTPLRIGIGIDAGTVVVGEMGRGGHGTLTAIGDAVNPASRLQELTKTYDCDAVLSRSVARASAMVGDSCDPNSIVWREVELRGRNG